jgi:HEAT repeat protein
MKKINYIVLFALLLCSRAAFAQSPENRTVNTLIADVLAQTPAQNEKQFIQQQKDLITTGESGIQQLVKMLSDSEKENKVKAEYALSGLTHYVSTSGQETARFATINAYLKALDGIKDNESKTFIIQQIAIAGKDEAIRKLSGYLDDPIAAISSHAAQALLSIHTPAAGKALIDALKTATRNASKKNIITAISGMELPEAEEPLRALLNENDALRETVLLALGRIGSKASLPDLALAASKINYAPEKTGAVVAYLTLIRRIAEQGNATEVEKITAGLMKKAEKAGQLQIREAALQIRMKNAPDKVYQLLKEALKDGNKDYRNAALNFTSDFVNPVLGENLIATLKKTNLETKAELLAWFKGIYDDPKTKERLVNSYTDVFASLLTSKDQAVKEASAALLAKISDNNAIAALSKLLNSPDNQNVELAKNTLIATQGDIAPAIVPFLSTATDVGKIAILELLAIRKADNYSKVVFEQLNAAFPDVRSAAYAALKSVVSGDDLPALFNLLDKADETTIIPVQQAVVASLKRFPQEKRLETVFAQINQTDKAKQYLYYNALTATDHPKALAFIVERFNAEQGPGKEAAFQSLSDWQGVEASDELFAICKDTSATAYSDRALKQYVRMITSSGLTDERRRIFLTNALEIATTADRKNEILQQIAQTGSFLGLLSAGNYLEAKDVQQAAAEAVMNIALNHKNYNGKNVRGLLERAAQLLNNPDAGYQREAIRKHLDEMPKEEGFVPVFNGKDLTGWKGLVENPIIRAKMKPSELAKKQLAADEIARKHWTVDKGMLLFDGKEGDNLCTIKQYGDFEMYVDWKLEPAPEADAGIYLRGVPQVQIWNTDRIHVGAQVGSGGLYNNKSNPDKPIRLADNKLGEWNTFYIKMIGDRVTVLLNGELVVDNVILENYWDRSQPVFPTEQIELQAHGSKVYYRNIYIKELERPQPFELTKEEKKEGFRILFDGTNMHAWTGNTVDYLLENGCISLYPKNAHGGNLYTKDEFGNFIFRFEFQLTPGANNGLGIRTPMEGDAAYVGMELQILDNEAPVYKDLAAYQYHGSVYGIIPAMRGFLKPAGEWNYQEVIAQGDRIKVALNGTVILDGNIREAVKKGTPDKQEHPGLFNKKGHIGFLGHGSHVKFRNIRIKEWK